jgi:ribonucleoside-diphosphate reductase beta chain
MNIKTIRKRDGTLQAFDISKIENAIKKALAETKEADATVAAAVASLAHEKVLALCVQAGTAVAGSELANKCVDGSPSVEEIQDLVEQALMEKDLYATAKAYIIYRSARKKLRERDLFRPRTNVKPYEYPELHQYADAIRHSYWLHTEFNYTADIQDYKTLPVNEVTAMKRSLMAVAQSEVSVCDYWSKVVNLFPKPEIAFVGTTFAESEVRHAEAYAHLIEILGLNQEFEDLLKVPAIRERVDLMDDALAKMGNSQDRAKYMHTVMLFSLFVEQVSLFSQFLVILSFNKHKNIFKGVSNVAEATSKEEQIHTMFGVDVVNILRKEHPEMFDDEVKEVMRNACKEAVAAEYKIVDWIFEHGDLDFVTKADVKEFIKDRVNRCFIAIGMEKMYDTDEAMLEQTEWFDTEIVATKHVDFFYKRSINYNKKSQSVTSSDLF